LLAFAAGSFLFIVSSTVLRELPAGKVRFARNETSLAFPHGSVALQSETGLVFVSMTGGYMLILLSHYFVHGAAH
jgi:hypothetical protein